MISQVKSVFNCLSKFEIGLQSKDDSIENELSGIRITKVETLDNISKQISDTLKDINKRMSTDGLLGIATGFDKIDKFTGGWQETDLVIIGGASSMGKTSFALAILLNACEYSNTPSVIFSYEMSSNQLLKRLKQQLLFLVYLKCHFSMRKKHIKILDQELYHILKNVILLSLLIYLFLLYNICLYLIK